jgi:hypothetical protein
MQPLSHAALGLLVTAAKPRQYHGSDYLKSPA